MQQIELLIKLKITYGSSVICVLDVLLFLRYSLNW